MRRPLSTIVPRRSAQRPRTFRRLLLGRPSWSGALARCVGLLLALGLIVAPTNAFSTSAGAFTIAPGQSRTLEVAERAQDAYGSVKFVVPEQRTVWMALQFRAATATQGYRTRVRVLPNGAVWAGFSRVADGQETLLVSEPTPLTVQTGQTVVIEGKVIGTDPVELSVRVRIEGVPQEAWQRTARDDSAARVTTPGKTRAWAYLSQAATGAARVSFSAASVTIADLPVDRRAAARTERDAGPDTLTEADPDDHADPEADSHPDPVAEAHADPDAHPQTDPERVAQADAVADPHLVAAAEPGRQALGGHDRCPQGHRAHPAQR